MKSFKTIIAIAAAGALIAARASLALGHSTLPLVDPEYREAAQRVLLDITSDEDMKRRGSAKPRALDGNSKVEILSASGMEMRLFRPKGSEGKILPVIYYCHGGGFLLRGAYYSLGYQKLADMYGAAIVLPRYRTSMEAPFPAQLEDAAKGLRHVYLNGASLGLDTSRIALMGDSAGGGLCASLALYNQRHDAIPLRAQILVYPMLDCRTGTKDDRFKARDTGEFLWNRPTNAYAWRKLRGGKAIPKEDFGYFSPSYAVDLAGLPPAFIYVGTLDLFANEDIDYANRLIAAGVPTELHVIPGLYHGFDGGNPTARKTLEFREATRRALDEAFARK
ncbi:MAG: alpha/beta hydrolase [Succinivibrio sp.]